MPPTDPRSGMFGELRRPVRGCRPPTAIVMSTLQKGNSKFAAAFNVSSLPPRPTSVYGFAELDVLSPADVLRRHLSIFSPPIGTLPSVKPSAKALSWKSPYRPADAVKVSVTHCHRLTAQPSSPSKRPMTSTVVLYTHDSPFLDTFSSQTKKVTEGALQPLVDATGFTLNELFRFNKAFLKLRPGPHARGIDLKGFSAFIHRFGPFDESDEKVNQRMFVVQNQGLRGNFLDFDRVIDLLQQLKKSDTLTMARFFYTLVDERASDRLSLNEIDSFFGGPDKISDIVKEHRRLSVNKIMSTIYQVLEKDVDARITKEEFLSALMLHADSVRFFDRAGYLVMASSYY